MLPDRDVCRDFWEHFRCMPYAQSHSVNALGPGVDLGTVIPIHIHIDGARIYIRVVAKMLKTLCGTSVPRCLEKPSRLCVNIGLDKFLYTKSALALMVL